MRAIASIPAWRSPTIGVMVFESPWGPYTKSEIPKWTAVIKASGAKLD
jgi:hypothetical protein